MERITEINFGRIEWCSAERGLSVEELAGQLGIAKSTVEHLRRSNAGLTFNQLKKIANFFNRGVLFFLEPGHLTDERYRSLQFRTIANRKADLSSSIVSIIERAEHQRDVYASLIEDLSGEVPEFKAPTLQENIAQSAQSVREWLELGNQNDFGSYREAIERAGILVFRSNGYSGKWKIPQDDPILGFSIYDASCPLIFVKKQDALVRQTFTVAHELGHLLLHKRSFVDDEADMFSVDHEEVEANAFAGHFLVPQRLLDLIDDSTRPDEVTDFEHWLRNWCIAWGVSTEVVLRRLLDAGRLSQELYNNYRAWKDPQPKSASTGGSRVHRHREPMHMFGNGFVSAVLESLSSRRITPTKASQYLDNLKLSDIHRLENYYAGF